MGEFNGHLAMRAEARADGRTVLATQSFRAPYHLSKPYWDEDSQTLLVQVVNPTAGILAGDRLESAIAVSEAASLLVTAPSASRLFQMNGGKAECRQQFVVAKDAWLEVMPEPLVPHRGCNYRQMTQVDVEAGGGLFFADLLMPGRVGHGEAWEWDKLCLEIEVRSLADWAGSGAGACFGNAVLIGDERPDDEVWQKGIAALHADGLWLGLSRLRLGGWSLKLVAIDGIRLRQGLKDVRKILSTRFPRLACNPRKL